MSSWTYPRLFRISGGSLAGADLSLSLVSVYHFRSVCRIQFDWLCLVFVQHLLVRRWVSSSFLRLRERERRDTHTLVSFWQYNTYVDELSIVTLTQIVQNARSVKHGHVGHIFNFFEFWWIDFFHLLGFDISYLIVYVGEIYSFILILWLHYKLLKCMRS